MDTLISFDDLKAGAKALKKLAQAFMRAGTPVAATDVDPKTKRSSGINYRQVLLTFADNQKVQLGIKTTGDIFEVKVNGSVLPIKAQDDQRKAVAEIVKALDAGRAKFQAKLARQKVALPKGITTAAPKMEQKLAQASADLDAQITTAKARVNELRAELGEPVLDAAKKTGFMAFNVDSTNKFTVYVKVEDGMSDKDARSDAIEATRAELGSGATRVKEGGRRVSKVPADAWEAGKAKGWAWFAKGHLSMPTLDPASTAILDSAVSDANAASLAAAKADRRVLKATARRNADWKEGDEVKGDVLFVWDAALAPPYAEGQYPRIGNEGWTASANLFDFEPATADEVASVLDAITIPKASELSGGAQDVLEKLNRLGPQSDGDIPSKAGRDELVELGLVERVDGDNRLTAKGKGCAGTLDAVKGPKPPTKKQAALLDFIKTQIGIDLAPHAKYVKNSVIGVDVSDYEIGSKFSRVESLGHSSGRFRVEPNGYKAMAIIMIDGKALDAVDVPTNTFDNPDVLAAQQIAQQVNSGMALDDAAFPHALATLYIALDTVETNHPINLAEGDLAQAELEERAAEDFRAAIKVLEGQQVAA